MGGFFSATQRDETAERNGMNSNTGREAMSECSCSSNGCEKTVLLYACSGGANVAEVADQACRRAMYDGVGSMFCLAGLGADIDGMVQAARDADVNIVVDGCAMDCAKKVFERLGVTNFTPLRVTDWGIEKQKGIAATEEQIALATTKLKEAIAKE